MSEQPADMQRNCSSLWPVTHVFRTFSIALHPGKIGLALIALILTLFFGWLLDKVWLSSYQPVAGEVNAFWQTPDIDQWRDHAVKSRNDQVAAAYQRIGQAVPKEIANKLPDDKGVNAALGDLKAKYKTASKSTKDETAAVALGTQYNSAYQDIAQLRREGVFCSFVDYEKACVRQFIVSAATFNFTDRLQETLNARNGAMLGSVELLHQLRPENSLIPLNHSDAGALASLILMARGLQWLLLEHPCYAIVFGLIKLAIWSIFGGAICRMAALQFARDERIPAKTALAFSRRKFIGFFTAPLMPIAVLVVGCVVLALAGLVCKIPYFGELLLSLGLILVLVGGILMAAVTIGFMAGGSLMWPTIAAEGSDSFDAMSRSYSYIVQRPWKAVLYALVASVYGSMCYLFLRFFVFVALRLSRSFLALGLNVKSSRPGTGIAGAGELDAIWPKPSFDSLWSTPSPFSHLYWEWLSSKIAMCWVGLLVLTLAAFMICFYFSASTIIYFLLRREVDSADLEDVDTEDEAEEDFIPATISGASPTGAS